MIYRGKERENHAGSIVRWPMLKKNEDVLREDNPIVGWREGILIAPVEGQLTFTEEYGLCVLSRGQYPLVEIIEVEPSHFTKQDEIQGN